MTQIGVIGLGRMGSAIARRLIAVGLVPTVYDVRPLAITELLENGARAASSARDVAEQADIVSIWVLNDMQVDDVLHGVDGVFESVHRPLIVLVHSTIRPTSAKTIAKRAAEAGISVVDAPVSGGVTGATDGTLTVFTSGSDQELAGCAPVLEAITSRVVHTGTVGSAQTYKIANNLISIMTAIGTSHAVSLATAAGIDVPELLAAVSAGSGSSWIVDHWLESHGDTSGHGNGRTYGLRAPARKDLAIASDMAHDYGLDMPVLDAIREALESEALSTAAS